MAPRITVPLFITCEREACGKVIQVRDRCLQRVQRFCGLTCAAIARNSRPHTFLASQKGGKERGRRARLKIMERVKGMTPVEAFRLGYVRGLQSKHRQLANRRAA